MKVKPNKNALILRLINCTKKQGTGIKTKEEKGITLIVLLITVILLVILVGVTVANVTGNEGIIVGTETAVDDYKYQQYKEQIEQLVHSIIIKDSLAGRTTTVTSMAEEMEKETWIKEAVPNEESKDIIVTVDAGYIYQIYYDELTGMIDINGVGTGGEGGSGEIAKLPTIKATYNKEKYTIEVEASCEDGIEKIELIYGGEVIETVNSETASFEVEKSGWYQVKATSGKGKTRYANVRVSNEVGAPSIKVTSNGEEENGWYGKDNVPVEVTISSEETNVKGIYYKKNTDTEYTYVEGRSMAVTINTAGRTVIYAYAVDGRGNESDIVRIEVKYDNVAPQVGAVAVSPEVPASGWYNTDVVVSIPNAEDTNSGIAGYYYWEVVGDVAEVPDEEKTYVSGASKTLTIKSEGIKVLAFQAIDKAGNKSGISNITVQKDSTNPRSFTISVSNQNKTGFTINAGTTDDTTYTNDVSGMNYYEVYVNGSLAQKIDVTDEANTGMSYTCTDLVEDSTYTVYVVAYDKAGNKTESTTMTILAQDITTGGGGQETQSQLLPPAISLSGSTQTNGYYTGNVTVTIQDSASENTTKATKIRYKVEGANAISETTLPGRTASFIISADGASTITAYAVDNEGNTSEASGQIITKDTTQPTLATLSIESYERTTIGVTASGADDVSGIGTYSFQISTTNNPEDFTNVITISNSAGNYKYTYSGLSLDTTYYLRVVVTDKAGNSTTSNIVTQKTRGEGMEISELSEEIGKYVNYLPTAKFFTSQGQYNGGADVTLSTDIKSKWRILFVEDNKISLISEKPVNAGFYLGDYNGYNNGVLLLNNACKEMYSNEALGGIARSLNIDDIEKVSRFAGTSLAECEAYEEWYPEIFEYEKTGAPGGIYGKKYDLSDQDKYIIGDNAGGLSIKGKITYYTYTMTNDYMKPIYLELFRYIAGTETNLESYWLASRCVNYNDVGSYFDFCLFSVNNGAIGGSKLYRSDLDDWSVKLAMRPVIEFDLTNVIIGSTGTGTAEDPYSIVAK